MVETNALDSKTGGAKEKKDGERDAKHLKGEVTVSAQNRLQTRKSYFSARTAFSNDKIIDRNYKCMHN